MNSNVIAAIFRRNFFSYFSNPTGYVFICMFVLLSSFAAFWPNEFFNANLDNLDQLNKYLPYILLVFIPAITMSIWAEERRQGTDELLLTIPATDFDVVVGKYLAAVAIYSVALLFSLVCDYIVLFCMGYPDPGLFLATFIGYWMVGVAMLAIGMVASFLTGNLTVGFVLGAAFNAPFAFAGDFAAWIEPYAVLPAPLAWMGPYLPSINWIAGIKGLSISEQFRDFGRGVLSLPAIVYFLMIVVVALYLCMVLIGRRHWQGNRSSNQGWHYLARAVSLVLIAGGLVAICDRSGVRADISSEGLSSLSSQTRTLVRELEPKHPVQIDAYISPEVPETYVQTRLNLLSALREFQALGSGKVFVRVHDTVPLSEEAERAEKLYGITTRQVATRSRGAMKFDELCLGVAFSSGLNRVVIPFFDYGTPVEYELARSIATVSQQQRKKLGVLTTDARLFGGFDPSSMSQTQSEMVIEELEKQYEVKQVSPDQPIKEHLDVLLAVQPSSLSPEQMDNFLAVVESGQPTAIFEDPFPFLAQGVPATSAPKQPAQQNPFMMGGQPPPQPKGNIGKLWTFLGVDFAASSVVWQDYNPYPRFQFPPEFVFTDAGASLDKSVFNQEDPISSGLQELLFLFPGHIAPVNATPLGFKALATTGDRSGVVAYGDILQRNPFGGGGGGLNPNRRHVPTRENYVLAAHIKGTLKSDVMPMSDKEPETGAAVTKAPTETKPADTKPADVKPAEPKTPAQPEAAKAPPVTTPPVVKSEPAVQAPATSAEANRAAIEKALAQQSVPAETPSERKINVVLVADIDVLYSDFFRLRAQGSDPSRSEFMMNLDNVTFVLNVLDVLAGDDRFVEIRKRRPTHRTLEKIESVTEKARTEAMENRDKFIKEFDDAKAAVEKKFADDIKKLEGRKDLDPQRLMIEVQLAQEVNQRRLQAQTQQLQKKRDQKTNEINRELAVTTRKVHSWYKMWAVILPPIPPLLVGLGVYFNRRAHEREGVARSRLR
jgi:ABC-2 type transport system permease protein